MNSSGHGRRKRKFEEKKAESIKAFTCLRCSKSGSASYLSFNFRVTVCDDCRDNSGEDKLITKTEMIKTFKIPKWPMEDFLKEYPTVSKQNPRHERGAPMTLIYYKHAEEFATKFHGGSEAAQKILDKTNSKQKIDKNEIDEMNKVTGLVHLANLAKLAGGVNLEKDSDSESKSIKTKHKNKPKNKKLEKKNICMEHKFGEPVKIETEEVEDSSDSDGWDVYEQTCELCGHVNRYEEF